MNLAPLRSVLLITAVSLMLYSRLTRRRHRVHVSKDMAYRSAVVFLWGSIS